MKRIALFLLLLASNIYSAEYYFSTSGDDGNLGTEASPFQTLSHLATLDLTTGTNTIYFNKGDDWTSELFLDINSNGSELNIFDAYGVGNDPILPSINIVSSLDSNYLIRNLNIKSVTPSRHAMFVQAGAVNITIDNCTLDANNYEFRDGILFRDGSDLIVANCILKNGTVGLVFERSNGLLFEYNTGECNTEGTVLIYEESYDGIVRYNNLECESSLAGAGIEVGWNKPHDIEVYGNIIRSNNIGIFVSGYNNKFYNNLIIDGSTHISTSGIFMSSGFDGSDPSTYGTHDNLMSNNTYIGAGRGLYIGIDFNTTNSCYNNKIYNNAFYTDSINYNIQLEPNVDFTSFQADYNCYYKIPTAFTFRVFDGDIPANIDTFTAWQSAPYNQDLNSINTDPLFDDIDIGTLLTSSPCINIGINLFKKFEIDYNQNIRYGDWDLGAYSYNNRISLNNIYLNNVTVGLN